MANFTGGYSTGDLISPLAQSLLMTCTASGTINKGDAVAINAAVTDGSALFQALQNATVDNTAIGGIATDAAAGTPSVVPVLMHGLVAAVTQTATVLGQIVTGSATAGRVGATSIVAFAAQQQATVLGFSLSTGAAAGDIIIVFVVK